jgi:hypothetical protein
MLIAPFLLLTLGLIAFKIMSSGISLTIFVSGICGLIYYGTAVYLIVRGVNEN